MSSSEKDECSEEYPTSASESSSDEAGPSTANTPPTMPAPRNVSDDFFNVGASSSKRKSYTEIRDELMESTHKQVNEQLQNEDPNDGKKKVITFNVGETKKTLVINPRKGPKASTAGLTEQQADARRRNNMAAQRARQRLAISDAVDESVLEIARNAHMDAIRRYSTLLVVKRCLDTLVESKNEKR